MSMIVSKDGKDAKASAPDTKDSGIADDHYGSADDYYWDCGGDSFNISLPCSPRVWGTKNCMQQSDEPSELIWSTVTNRKDKELAHVVNSQGE